MRWLRSGDDRKQEASDEAAASAQPADRDGSDPAHDPAHDPGDVPPPPDVPVDLVDLTDDELDRARRRAVARALAEDLGDRGDVTSLATVPPGTTGVAQLVARADGVVCGLDLVREAFDQVDTRVEVILHATDGDRVTRGDILGDVSGPLRSILTAERTALNFLTHLSGIATRTRQMVDAVEGTGCHVRDTRKTLPGLRLLEKHAVRAGGGHNHRIGLHDVLLVKDNHVVAAGSVTAAVTAALHRAGGLHVQVEVASLEELEEALAAGATDVLLDNFTPEEVRQALHRTDGRASLEASGTIDLETVRDYAATGVHRVAVGSITHSAPALDIALDVETREVGPTRHAAAAQVWGDQDRDVAEAEDLAAVGERYREDDDVEPPDVEESLEEMVADDLPDAAEEPRRASEETTELGVVTHDPGTADDAGFTAEIDAVAAIEAAAALAGDEPEAPDTEEAAPEDATREDAAPDSVTTGDEEPGGLFAWRERQVRTRDGDD